MLAGGAAAFALPWYAILCLPVLFAAGMRLLDTIDGCFMNFAYGWAFSQPVRKVYYNMTVDRAVGGRCAGHRRTIELLGLLAEKFNIASGPLAFIGSIDLNWVGFVIVGVFVVTWMVALVVYRFGRIEEKWSVALQDADA